MSFNPSRATPRRPQRQPLNFPLRPSTTINTLTSDTSYSSANSALNFAILSPQDVEIIDSIIARTPSTAKEFLQVFNAYNQVLEERGMDPSEDVVYYRYLLKLGVVRGSWKERWDAVKSGGGNSSALNGSTSRPFGHHDPSHDHDHESTDETTTELDETPAHESSTPRRTKNAVSNRRSFAAPQPPPSRGRQFGQKLSIPATTPSHSKTPDATSSVRTGHITRGSSSSPSVGPPSYRTYLPDSSEPTKTPTSRSTPGKLPIFAPESESTPRTKPIPLETPPPPSGPPTLARFAEAAARAGKLKLASAGKKASPGATTPGGSVINAEKTWKLLDMEADADDWRRSRTLKTCFYVWLGGVQWYQRRTEQVEVARAHVTLRHSLRIWHSRATYYTDLNHRAIKVSTVLLKRSTWKVWKAAFTESRRKKWQEDMKRRMALVRQKNEERLLFETLSIWHRRHRSLQAVRIASQLDKRITFRRFVSKLRLRLNRIDEIEDIADRVVETRDRMAVENAIAVWTRRVRLNRTERIIVGIQDARLVERLFGVWKDAVAYTQVAQEQRRHWVLKKALTKWRKGFTRLRIMERRAEDFIFNQENVLIRGTIRAWVAQERGVLLERVRRSRLFAAYLDKWREKMSGIYNLELRLNTFTNKTRLALLEHAFAAWYQDFSSLQTYNLVAEQQYALSVHSRSLVTWKAAVADNVRKMKSAKIARRWFLLRRGWKVWKKTLEERKMVKKMEEDERKLELYEREWLRKRLLAWHAFTQKERQDRFLVMAFNEKIEQRVMVNTLGFWISRVVENKSQELQISDERDAILQRSAFERWRDVFRRHGEALHLMQSFHEVKQEYLLRRTFQRWLALTRKSIQRQRRLEEVKEERRKTILRRAWDTWRGSFKQKELAPLERQFRAQVDINIMFRAYRIWESKTVYVPALRYFSVKFKATAFARWKEAAGPPMLARQAREWDRNTLLSKMFTKWKDAYREKSQLKAIARARHHRLPGAPISRTAFRRPSFTSRPFPSASTSTPQSAIARATARVPSPERPPSLHTQIRNQRELDDDDEEDAQEDDKASQVSRSPPRSERLSRLANGLRRRSPSIGARVKATSAIAMVRSARSVRTAPSETGRRAYTRQEVGDDRLDEDAVSVASSPRTAPFTRPRAGTGSSTVNALTKRAAALASGAGAKLTPAKEPAGSSASPATGRERLRMELKTAASRRGAF
ncbi:hypothetical protein M407DRAFT_27154 [Tulasnella calospora MUT 4182]|uniref:Sfi1 spindle body domain-containing protein n=1 Tax=Tulasnella calospora MUT 4182 TaxID=1051891 RepID=A0A0C3Q3Q2_9AGAM|nr:hypothetical protein M407DRAFT_27154 [Tulasnella calospora MUT 4182]